MPRESRPEGVLPLRMEVTPEVRDRLMVLAAQRGQSMAAYLREVANELAGGNMLLPRPPKPRKKKGDSR